MAIAAGRVTVGGAPADKPSRMVSASEPLLVAGDGERFVSRGGLKLDGALDHFVVDVTDRRALDAGASTGGFTDCLLQRGATTVYAVDVGYGQLHERLRDDARVRLLERTNIRSLEPDAIDGPVDVVVADLSFISLRTVIEPLLACAAPAAPLVLLIKPQFEAGRVEASRGGGVIRDPEVRDRTVAEVCAALGRAGARIMGTMVSPLTGADGNVEFFVYAESP